MSLIEGDVGSLLVTVEPPDVIVCVGPEVVCVIV